MLVSLSLEQGLLLLLIAYITSFALLGATKGRGYLTSHGDPTSDYSFHSVNVTLTLAGFAITALVLFISLGFDQLQKLSSIVLFFSISFTLLTLPANLARFSKRAFTFASEVLADVGILATGCGFLVFFARELPHSYELSLIFGLFIAFFWPFRSLTFISIISTGHLLVTSRN